MNMTSGQIWLIITFLALGSFLIRFSFLGLIGNRPLPPWILRHLRYTPVAVLPGLVAPLVLWPQASGGQPDPARLAAAFTALAIGHFSKNVLAAIIGGAITLFAGLWLQG
ncbi:MAG: AzlD domain-containing protein [Rhodobacteraceae bacterium]|nr:AzlD domain-containing protein [Paracoccaceae bacterium]